MAPTTSQHGETNRTDEIWFGPRGLSGLLVESPLLVKGFVFFVSILFVSVVCSLFLSPTVSYANLAGLNMHERDYKQPESNLPRGRTNINIWNNRTILQP